MAPHRPDVVALTLPPDDDRAGKGLEKRRNLAMFPAGENKL
jgi:hypothetical protein